MAVSNVSSDYSDWRKTIILRLQNRNRSQCSCFQELISFRKHFYIKFFLFTSQKIYCDLPMCREGISCLKFTQVAFADSYIWIVVINFRFQTIGCSIILMPCAGRTFISLFKTRNCDKKTLNSRIEEDRLMENQMRRFKRWNRSYFINKKSWQNYIDEKEKMLNSSLI